MPEIKPFTDLSATQVVTIAKLALESVLTWDYMQALLSAKTQEENWRTEWEIWWAQGKDNPKDLWVVRIYPDGLGDTHCAIWEEDGENHINVTAYDDKNEAEVANMCLIVKHLINWGFV